MEFLKDYDLMVEYHLLKENMIDDVLSRKSIVTLASLRAKVYLADDWSLLVEFMVRLIFLPQIMESQLKDEICDELKQQIGSDNIKNFSFENDGELCFMRMLYVPKGNNLR